MSIRLQPVQRPIKIPHARRRPKHSGRTATAMVPAAARTPTVFSTEELDLAGAAIETFTQVVGGRSKLLQTLAVADSGSDKVVNCLLDPAYASWSLRRLCAYAGITVADLFASYKKALFVAAHIDAAHRITSALPPLVDDVMRRALPQPLLCPRCQGTPTTPGTSHCPQCQGVGTILTEPDLDRQKLALELGKLTERKAGVMVQQNAISASSSLSLSSSPGSLEQLQQAVGDLLFSPQRRRAASPAAASSVPATVIDDPRPDLPVPRGEPDDPNLPSDDADDDDDDAPLQT